ncbi:MAG TPA: NAD(P)-dependent oxidoreductase [Polyangia bacterium]|nr:NAD(P)-dependent oxidoreductase [Polyangia bacterium]
MFLKVAGRRVVVVGGGPVAAAKIEGLAGAGAEILVVAPELRPEIAGLEERGSEQGDGGVWRGLTIARRAFRPDDLDGAWLVVAAATSQVNRQVAAAAEARRLFVVAVDDPQAASAYGAGVVRRAGVTLAVSTDGTAPALAGLLREGLDAILPDEDELGAWMAEARAQRAAWRAGGVAMGERRPLLLSAINRLYEKKDVI